MPAAPPPSHLPILLALLLLALLALGLQIGWLVFQSWRTRRREHMAARIAGEMAPHLPTTLADRGGIDRWVAAAGAYPRGVVRALLAPMLTLTVGEPHATVVEIWRALGFLDQDLAHSRSRFLSRRVRAMRRLSLVAGPSEATALLERSRDVHVIRVMVAQTLVRIGTPADLRACFASFALKSRLLEQPLAEVLSEVSLAQLDALLELLAGEGDPCVRRLILVAAARIAPDECLRRLPAAAAHPDRELRIGACQAVAVLGASELAPFLVAALVDPAAEVRAQAAKALGRLRVASTIEPLALALRDSAFWVRQNAAASLGSLGAAGRRRLQQVAEDGNDRYAADSARQELRRLAALEEGPVLAGAVS